MEYIKVESSQIDSVGFGEGHYGSETLGIRFKSKRGITEYHYGGVRHDMYVAFIEAKSVGIFFKDYIKQSPDLYPFTKVEADPQQPSISAASNTQEDQEDTNGGQTSPGSALATIDGLKPEFIFVPGNLDSILSKVRDEVLEMAKGLDPSTPAKQKRIREIKGLVVSRRTFIEKVRVGYVADLVLKKGVTDTVSKVVQGRLSAIEDEILKVTGYAAWEQEVKDSKAKNERIIFTINAMEPHTYPTIDSLILAIAELNAIDTSGMQEFTDLATGAKENHLKLLTADLVKRQTAEAESLELEQLRAAKKAREDADRIAKAAEELAADKIQAAVEAAQAATRQEVIAELAAPVVEEPVDDMPVTTVKALPFVGMVETREQAFNREAVAGFMGHCGFTRQQAIAGLTAINKGLIPHIEIHY